MTSILVFGGAHIDREYVLTETFVPGVSNPCRGSIVVGGVAHNIAAHVKAIGTEDVSLVSTVGNDENGNQVISACESIGVDTRFFQRDLNYPTGEYICAIDDASEVLFGLANMDIYEDLTVDTLEVHKSAFEEYKHWVVDTNFSADVLRYILESNADGTSYMTVTSMPKVLKAKDSLKYVDHIFLNTAEASGLFDEPITNNTEAIDLVKRIHDLGPSFVYLTQGDNGCLFSDGNVMKQVLPTVKKVVRTGGAGDAFSAACIYAYASGSNEFLSFGMDYVAKFIEGLIDPYHIPELRHAA